MSRTCLNASIGTVFIILAGLLASSCSSQNQDGPDVSCEDLECGRINACSDGIIAQCVDGAVVRYHVCRTNDEHLCSESWQQPGAFRCTETTTDCEGCRPERVDGCGFFGAGGATAD